MYNLGISDLIPQVKWESPYKTLISIILALGLTQPAGKNAQSPGLKESTHLASSIGGVNGDAIQLDGFSFTTFWVGSFDVQM